jgi:hypothetical protein
MTPTRSLRSRLTNRHVAANECSSRLKGSASGCTVCCPVRVKRMPYCQRLLQTEIVPQKLSLQLSISILPGSSGNA